MSTMNKSVLCAVAQSHFALAVAEAASEKLKRDFTQLDLDAKQTQSRTASICRQLEKALQIALDNLDTEAHPTTAFRIQAMINTIHSYQRYMLKKILGVNIKAC